MHRVPNYGSFMQAFSLKKIIESLGHEVVFVDYKVDPDIESRKNKKKKIRCIQKLVVKKIKGTKLGGKLYLVIKLHSASRDIVEKQNIFFSCNDLLGVSAQYHFRTKVDVLIIGSDEVFNCTQVGFNVGYSLELFGKNNRAKRVISYAASFGNTTYEKLISYGVTDEIGYWLNRMNSISVRDENSYSIVKKICHKEPKRHLDPVLVGNIEDVFFKLPEQKDYIILYGYMYRFTEQECDKIMEYAHSIGKKVIAIGEQQYKYDEYICCKPDEVIGYFKKADYVITDTFHGSIFSIITHKKFVSVIRHSQANAGGNEEKLESLLADLELRDRQLFDFDHLAKITNSIDYKKVDLIRKKAREATLEYISANLI